MITYDTFEQARAHVEDMLWHGTKLWVYPDTNGKFRVTIHKPTPDVVAPLYTAWLYNYDMEIIDEVKSSLPFEAGKEDGLGEASNICRDDYE